MSSIGPKYGFAAAVLTRMSGARPSTSSLANSASIAAVYAATKAAIHAFAEGLRQDLLGTAIRVTVLMPGRVQTRLYDAIYGGTAAASAALYDGFEAVQPSELAAVIEHALELPAHVDLTAIEVVPTGQVFGGSQVARRG